MNGAVLKTSWQALLARIDALSRRERLMVLAAALALVGVVGDTLLLAPQRAQRLQLERDAARERSELAAMDVQIAELKRKLAADPDEVPRLRLQQLSAELSELNAGFQRLERSLVPPEQMARLLEQVMQRTAGISVVRLQTLPPRSLPERESDAAVGASDQDDGHGLICAGLAGPLLSVSEPVCRRDSRRSRDRLSCRPSRLPHTSPAAGRGDTSCRPGHRAEPA